MDKTMQWYTYIIYSSSTDRYYVGHTQDLTLRLERHNSGNSRSTKHGIPWELVYFESYSSKSEAMKREYEIKRKSNEYI
ncbi:GIY-YIG nuclease family protein [Melioribacter sp. OK-6-Me]|uniref:GIY-YIG nuclease family protein n=1 Tax=unclassified Melioribacter TaxID=2627329 RepID=UPI003EDA9B2C